jgi:uncharacterized coiled-coil protein SlyX
MKFDVQQILTTLTRRQRMTGLVILVIATVLIFVLPPYFKSVSPEIVELKETISFQQSQIETLNVNIVVQNEKLSDLNNQIIINQQECTNRIVEREKEIMSIIDEMKKNVRYTTESHPIQDSLMIEYTPRVINQDKSYKTLCDLEKKIKKKN